MLRIEKLNKIYPNGTHALRDVSLEVPDGEFLVIIGLSGSGKSTLLRCINRLVEPTSGRIELDGVDVTAASPAELRRIRARIGMIFQHFNLLSSRTVQGNVELALEIAGTGRAERRTRAAEILELVGLTEQRRAYPAQLSGGQKQRVAIARALATNPSVLLSDEATSALDPETTRSVLDLIKRLSRELSLTVLLITHEMDVIKRVCDSAAVMADGRILEQGPVDRLLTTEGSLLAASLFELGELPPERGTTIIDVTFTKTTSSRPVVAQLARAHNLDVGILGAAIETIHDGGQTGRTRLEIPGSAEQVRAALDDLRGQGLFVEVVR